MPAANISSSTPAASRICSSSRSSSARATKALAPSTRRSGFTRSRASRPTRPRPTSDDRKAPAHRGCRRRQPRCAGAFLSSEVGRGRVGREARLRVKPDRRVDGAKAFVALALDDLEEEQILEAAGVELEIFAAGILVVENIVGLENLQPFGGQIDAYFQVVVVIFRNLENLHAVGLELFGRGHDVVGVEGDVL